MANDIEKINKTVKFWFDEIEQSKKRDEVWRSEASDAVTLYKSISPSMKNHTDYKNFGVRYNIFYSIVELLKSTLFNNFPRPDIRRRFAKKTDKNEVNQMLYVKVAEVAEDAISWNADTVYLGKKLKKSIKDYLIPGRGSVWVSYEPELSDDELLGQKVNVDYVYWKDLRISWARTWEDTWWVARRYYLSRQDLINRFGKIGNKIKLTETRKNEDDEKYKDAQDVSDDKKMAEVWEIWDKDSKTVYFISKGYPNNFIDKKEDPLGLSGFFPLPKPLQNIEPTDDNIPIPDFRAYKYQAGELSTICERISLLNRELKHRFLHAAKHNDTISKFSKLGDGEGLGVDIADIEAAGGLRNVIFTMPLEELVKVIVGLQEQKNQLTQEIYEITGIADLMRAVSNPNETATAQRIKGKFGSFRLQERQQNIQNYIKDLIVIMTEIICEHFTIDTLKKITGTDLPTEQEKAELIAKGQEGQVDKDLNDRLALPTWEEVLQILRDDKLRSYTIDIESTATAFDEEQEDKQKAIEFIQGATNMLTTSLEGAMQVPEIMPLMRDLTMFGIKQFKIGRSLEESFENSFNNLEQKLAQMQQSQQGEGAGEQAKAQSDMAKTQMQAQTAQLKAQTDLQKEQMRLSAQAQREQEKMTFEAQKQEFENQKKEAELNLQAQELERKQEKDLSDAEIKQEEVSIKQQEANRKDEELRVQAELKASELASQQAGQNVDINTNIAGDVSTLE